MYISQNTGVIDTIYTNTIKWTRCALSVLFYGNRSENKF